MAKMDCLSVCSFCHLIRMKFDVVMKQFKLNIPRLHLSYIFETREISAVLQTASKILMLICVRRFMNRFDSNWV